ncbi:tc1-mariner class transposase [Moniliophthora roreri]|uniref:Tc1-like transposase DDE domain-containing protein n=1 Tax=Moniliophthora roreri TaxID=221103 RepID=A0A0W0EVS2_MONRR|nr:tc1-mariner class transposase [Moniliophthora roreri]
MECNEEACTNFMMDIGNLVDNLEIFIFINKLARNKRTSQWKKGWSPKRERCFAHRHFVQSQRYLILPVLTLDSIIAHNIIPGSVTSKIFVEFLHKHVIPLTNLYPGPRSVLILDNCNIHHTEEVREIVKSAGCKLMYLPPYSPDLNSIKQAFSIIKAYL